MPAPPLWTSLQRETPVPPPRRPPKKPTGQHARQTRSWTLSTAATPPLTRARAAGDDRYMVHVVTRNDGRSYEFLNGAPVHPSDAASVRCDCSSVAHLIAGSGEPLNLGRKTREWSTAQRRAISVRDGGHCRFPVLIGAA